MEKNTEVLSNAPDLIQKLIDTHRLLIPVQKAYTAANHALLNSSSRLLNQIFEDLRNKENDLFTRRAEWSILEIDEYKEIVFVVIRFSVNRSLPKIPEELARELRNFYELFAEEAQKHFATLDNRFVIRAHFY